jgi:hypothetical protein
MFQNHSFPPINVRFPDAKQNRVQSLSDFRGDFPQEGVDKRGIEYGYVSSKLGTREWSQFKVVLRESDESPPARRQTAGSNSKT